EIDPFAYDPVKARALLTSAGYPNGFRMTLAYTVGRYPKDQELGEVVASYLEAVGITVEQRPLEWGGFQAARNAGTIGTHQWGLLTSPTSYSNFTYYITGARYQWHQMTLEFDRLFYVLEQEIDDAARGLLAQQMSRIMHEEVPLIFLVAPDDVYGASNKLVGFTPRPDQMLWFYDVDLLP
ncbi:MAG: ABC transporter substrate-binding protein, partial [Candidatus Bipolaricaulota bacterium]